MADVIPLRSKDVAHALSQAAQIPDLSYGVVVVMNKDNDIYSHYDCATRLQAIGMLELVKQRIIEEFEDG